MWQHHCQEKWLDGGWTAKISLQSLWCPYHTGQGEELLQPKQAIEIRIDLWDVAYTVLPDHAIRLEISSSNFPRFDRNLNSAVRPELAGSSDQQVAQQQVFHDAQHPSHLLLPVAG